MAQRLVLHPDLTATWVDYEPTSPGPQQVVVRSEYASLKHGTNLGAMSGANAGLAYDPEQHLFRVHDAPPRAQARSFWGSIVVGTVTAVGAEVNNLQAGDRVFGMLDVRDVNCCGPELLWPLGDIDPLAALCLEPAYVAFHSVRESLVRAGDTVAVVGLGAIGLLAVELAKIGGAAQVIAVDPLPARRACALALGAEVALDPAAGAIAEQVHDLTGGHGVDVAIEVAGKYAALNEAIRCTRLGGTVCLTGYYQGPAEGLWLGREAHHNRLTLLVPHGCGIASLPRDHPRWDEARAWATLVTLMRQGRLTGRGIIAPLVAPAEAPAAWRQVVEDPAQVIKLGIRFAP